MDHSTDGTSLVQGYGMLLEVLISRAVQHNISCRFT